MDITIDKKYDFKKDAVLLIQKKDHKIYWIGTASHSTFRHNIYLIKDMNEGIIIDCGDRRDFNDTKNRIQQVMPLNNISKIFLNHQDPDVASAMVDWLAINPNIEIIASRAINVLLQHYMLDDTKYKFMSTEIHPFIKLGSGAILEFIPSPFMHSPFMHSPGAVSVYNHATKTIFSGDIWASITVEWDLVLKGDFNDYIENLDFFHKDYISSNQASRNFLLNFKEKKVDNIMPQHGSIITTENVRKAFTYLKELKCGIDNFKKVSDEELAFIDAL